MPLRPLALLVAGTHQILPAHIARRKLTSRLVQACRRERGVQPLLVERAGAMGCADAGCTASVRQGIADEAGADATCATAS
jgi:hypothetical protein